MKRTIAMLAVLSLFGAFAAGCDDDGGGVSTCADLCGLTPVATYEQAYCVANYMTSQGYDVWGTPPCDNITTTAECNQCYANLQPTDEECVAAHNQCF
jgi:hypothetical protein